MTPAEVRDLTLPEFLAMLELMDKDLKERQRQARRKKR